LHFKMMRITLCLNCSGVANMLKDEMYDDVVTTGPVARKIVVSTWKLWFAWRPVKTKSGQQVWGKRVYRRCINTYVDHDDWRRYEYADIFDVLGEDD
jgi:hypothetical protein